LVPAACGGDDPIGIGGPDEGFGAVVGFGEEAFDRGLEIDERSEHAALQPSPGQLGTSALLGHRYPTSLLSTKDSDIAGDGRFHVRF
jgi:hypothetical protein